MPGKCVHMQKIIIESTCSFICKFIYVFIYIKVLRKSDLNVSIYILFK